MSPEILLKILMKGETKMKIDFTQVLKDLDGKEIKGPDGDITLGFICVDALLAPLENEMKTPNADDTIRRYEFAKAIHKGEEMELKVEDVALLKDRILKTRPALIYGITSDMLEKKEDERAEQSAKRPKPRDKD